MIENSGLEDCTGWFQWGAEAGEQLKCQQMSGWPHRTLREGQEKPESSLGAWFHVFLSSRASLHLLPPPVRLLFHPHSPHQPRILYHLSQPVDEALSEGLG